MMVVQVGGVSNYTNYDFDRYTAECCRHVAPILLGRARPPGGGAVTATHELHGSCTSLP